MLLLYELWRLSGGKKGDYQNCSVLNCVLKLCTVISTLRWTVLTVLWIGSYLQSTQIRPVCNIGITQFYLPPTHEPCLPWLPRCKASQLFGWYSVCLPTKGWPGWVDLGVWLHTEINLMWCDAWSYFPATFFNDNVSVQYEVQRGKRFTQSNLSCYSVILSWKRFSEQRHQIFN